LATTGIVLGSVGLGMDIFTVYALTNLFSSPLPPLEIEPVLFIGTFMGAGAVFTTSFVFSVMYCLNFDSLVNQYDAGDDFTIQGLKNKLADGESLLKNAAENAFAIRISCGIGCLSFGTTYLFFTLMLPQLPNDGGYLGSLYEQYCEPVLILGGSLMTAGLFISGMVFLLAESGPEKVWRQYQKGQTVVPADSGISFFPVVLPDRVGLFVNVSFLP
jgi:hypothetical protein